MKPPNFENGIVEPEKIVDYLLNPAHPDGWGKAQFFSAMGFRREEWSILAEALRLVVRNSTASRSVTSPHGRKYIVEGVLQTPSGLTPTVRTVWIVDEGTDAPRLVTAYPMEGDEQP